MRMFYLIILALCILVTQCIRDKSKPAISGFLFKTVYYDGDSAYDRNIQVYNYKGFSAIPLVKLNNEILGIYDWGINWYQFSDENIVLSNKDYELEVSHSDGTAKAKVSMPGNIRFTQPDTSYILKRESTLVIAWQKSSKATWYWLDYYISYEYLDTAGEEDSYDISKDTVITDTFCRLEPNRFFPSYVMNILEGEGEANVWAMDGPIIYPGSNGNVTGQGIGFFHAANQGLDAYFYVGARPSMRKLYKKEASREKLKHKLKILSP